MLTIRTLAMILILWMALPIGASAQSGSGTLTTTSPCTLPGPLAPNRCTVNLSVTKTGTPIACIWATQPTGLVACEGHASWNTNWTWVTTTPRVMELRAHSAWPANTEAERLAAPLLDQKTVVAATPSGTLNTDSPCQLPGPVAPDRCTVNLFVTKQHTPVACIWATQPTTLMACEGHASWSTSTQWVTATPRVLELRGHSTWPSNTDAARLSGPLLDQRTVVATTPQQFDNAQFISQSGPPTNMTTGQAVPVSVTMRNTGTTTWTAGGGYLLGSQNPTDNQHWGMHRVALPHSVAPNQNVTFNFTASAPMAAGTYQFRWRMLRNGSWFGDSSSNVTVTVTAPPYPRARNIAHRGNESEFLENSVRAFVSAANVGADIVELDVVSTSDGVPLVHHDVALASSLVDCDDKAMFKVNISQLSYAQISGSCRYRSDRLPPAPGLPTACHPGIEANRILTLREALNVISCLGIGVLIEMKDHSGAAVLTDLQSLGAQGGGCGLPFNCMQNVLVQSFSSSALQQFAGFLAQAPHPAYANIRIIRLVGEGTSVNLTNPSWDAQLWDWDGVAFAYQAFDINQIGQAIQTMRNRHPSRWIAVYTVRSAAHLSILDAAPLDGIITDRPRTLYHIQFP